MKKTDRIIFWSILILAVILRTVLLDKFPYGFHFDEAKAAWNAVSIGLTGKDDHGNFLPPYYDSFGDFRPTGIIYLLIPFVLTLGRTIWAVRLPAALIGALTVWPIYLLAKNLAPEKDKYKLSLMAAGLMAINPWHISVSRATSEVVVSLFLTTFGLYFLIKTIKTNKLSWAWASIGSLLLSFWFYHSIRLLAPVLVFATIAYYWSQNSRKLKLNWGIPVLIIISIISGILALSPEARGRLSQVSIRSDFKILYETQKAPNEEGSNNVLVARAFHNKLTILFRRFSEEYMSYLGTDFLVGRTAKPIRYVTTNFGLITYAELLLLLLGIAAAVNKKDIRLAWIWLLVAPIPAAMTMEDVPNLHRSMLMIPAMVLIEAWGLSVITEMNKKVVLISVTGLWAAHFIYYLHFYYNHGNYALSVYSRNGGIKEMVDRVGNLQGQYDKVVLPNYSDNPYAWYAFFENKDPRDFNQRYIKNADGGHDYQNVVFSNDRCPTVNAWERYKGKVLVVNGEGCEFTPDKTKQANIKLKETVYRLDQSPPFTIWERN